MSIHRISPAIVALSLLASCYNDPFNSLAIDESTGETEEGSGAGSTAGSPWDTFSWPSTTVVGEETTMAATTELTAGSTTGQDADDEGTSSSGDETSCGDGCGCGDGVLGPDELCDDGDDDVMDACVMCQPASCGDGYVHAGVEACDEGEDNVDASYTAVPGCDTSCQSTAYCGDGVLQAMDGESCDDGAETAACDADCTPASCGDGRKNETAGEFCDDGNMEETDACLSGCVVAVCGDGHIQAGVESCDDGNSIEDDECDNMCNNLIRRRVFVSSYWYEADLGGIAGADALCQTHALGLGGAFKAWISDGVTGPIDRFDTSFTGIYELVDGTKVADGWAGLTGAPLLHAINLDEDGLLHMDHYVWTNTKATGKPAGTDHCAGWTVTEGWGGLSGETLYTGSAWSASGTGACDYTNNLYCFEDPV